MDTPFADRTIDLLQDYCDTRFNGNIRAMAVFLGLDPDGGMLHRWLKKKNPTLSMVGPCLDKIGAVLIGPDEKVASIRGDSREEARLREELAQAKAQLHEADAKIYALQGQIEAYKSMFDSLLANSMSMPSQATFRQSGKGNQIHALNKK